MLKATSWPEAPTRVFHIGGGFHTTPPSLIRPSHVVGHRAPVPVDPPVIRMLSRSEPW